MLAAVAFTWCIAEIAQQQEQLGIDADWIYTSSVGGTQAGLVLGTKTLGLKMKPFGSAPIRWENKHERLTHGCKRCSIRSAWARHRAL